MRTTPILVFSGTLIVSGALAAFAADPAQARTICTMVADAARGTVLAQQGDCTGRVTPASTFKVPLAVMGFDSGFLKDGHDPVLAIRKGDPDWGGAEWKTPTDAERWLKYSVVWFSQRITHTLGSGRLTAYAEAFGYGNADFSGDPGKDNGLKRAWIASSLKISPQEQITFLRRLANRSLPVAPQAMDKTVAAMESFSMAGTGWTVRGKTGMAYPRSADGRFDYEHPWGWFVGLGQAGERSIVFVRLVQDEKKLPGSASARARDSILKDLPAILEKAGAQ
ncbi:class D beta-lactamase [Rhizobium sp. CSW-27]|uniref:class D beta-lactamase n=1 Tax=Rhizobium sp. CSW-27 TaxID=2839985 RepID=UPI001C012D29|nr:class D beta-lactamase [Rhizobium sp. CSW-27]MBT9370640.1 class D beta-lactamase [Rhizobium sp. CSW-27]